MWFFTIKDNILKYPYFVSIWLNFLVYCFSIWTEKKNPVSILNEMKLLSLNCLTDDLTTKLTNLQLAYQSRNQRNDCTNTDICLKL